MSTNLNLSEIADEKSKGRTCCVVGLHRVRDCDIEHEIVQVRLAVFEV